MPEYHDFGWALQSLRAGQQVRRHAWPASMWLHFDPVGSVLYKELSVVPLVRHWYDPAQTDLLATDWELADEKGQNGKDNEGV